MNLSLGTIFAVARLQDEMSGAMTVLARNVASRSGEVSAKIEGVSVSIAKVNSLVRDFSGAPAIKSAEEYAAAVQRIGGAANLTEAQQQRVNRSVNEALAHYRAVGQEAPKHLVALEQATRKVDQSTGIFSTTIGKLTSAFAIGSLIDRGASALVSFGVEALKSGGRILDMSNKMGVSIEAAQRLEFAAKQTGASIDAVGGSVLKMSDLLGSRDKGAVSALVDLGLGFDAIRSMKPEDAFMRIVEAVAAIEDPYEQARLVQDLFGRQGKELLPAIREGLAAIAKEAPVMADAMVRSMDRTMDNWEKFKTRVTNFLGDVLTEQDRANEALLKRMPEIERAMGTMEQQYKDAKKAADESVPAVRSVFAAFDNTAASARPAADAVAEFERAHGTMAAQVKKSKEVDEFQRKVDTLASTLGGGGLNERMRELAAAVAQVQREGGRVNVAMLRDELLDLQEAGAKLTPTLQRIFGGTTSLGVGQAPNATLMDRLFPKDFDVHARLATMDGMLESITANIGAEYRIAGQLATVWNGVGNEIDQAAQALTELGRKKEVEDKVRAQQEWNEAIQGTVGFFGQLGDFAGGKLGAMFEGTAVAIRGITAMTRAMQQFQSAATTAGQIAGFVSGYGAMISIAQYASQFTRGEDWRQTLLEIQQLGGAFMSLQEFRKSGGGNQPQWITYLRSLRDELKATKTETDAVTAAQDAMTKAGQFALEHGTNQWKDLKALAEEYEVDLSRFTHTFHDGMMADDVLKITQAWNDMLPYIGNADDLARDFADEAQGILDKFFKFGTAIPENMRPMLERMQALGLLTNAAGDKLEDLGEIKFSQSIEESLGDIVDIMRELVSIFKNDLPAAAAQGARETAENWNRGMGGLAAPNFGQPTIRPDLVGTDDGGPPAFDTRIRRVTKAGWGYMTPGDVAGKPSLTPGARHETHNHFSISALDGADVLRVIPKITNALRANGTERAEFARTLGVAHG